MLEEIIKQGKTEVFFNNKQVEIENIQEYLCDIVKDCYLAPCMALADENGLNIARKDGVWIEISFDDVMTYKDFDFEKLLINLYPKHDFLVMHRFVDEKYQGKSITVNLLYKTTELYKYIIKICEGLKNEK